MGETATTPVSFQPIPCPKCGSTEMEFGETVTVDTLTRSGDAGWQVTGQIELVRCMHGRCCNCGFVLDAIRQQIPVQYSSMRCQSCGQGEFLTCKVDELVLQDGAYRFAATFTCKYCGWKDTFNKLFERIWSILSVKIGPTGVEVTLDKQATRT